MEATTFGAQVPESIKDTVTGLRILANLRVFFFLVSGWAIRA